MTSQRYLIKNAQLVNRGKTLQKDILIENNFIQRIEDNISADQVLPAELIDATGLFAIPGMIDDQVHFREPGLTHKADIGTESMAAVAGGITSYMEMPNCTPPTTNAQALADKKALAAEKSHANYAFYLGATNHNLEDIKALDPNSAAGVKIFMGASTGDMLVDDPVTLENIFACCPTLIATHCEDTPSILLNERKFKQLYGDKIPMSLHPIIRSEEACYKSSSFAVALAKKHHSRLHVLHITTAKELELFDNTTPLLQKKITAEACVHHLFFSERDYKTLDTLIKCNPAIKKVSDREALIQAVQNNTIDVIATDHAPHLLSEKHNDYLKAPAGLPLVQHALSALLEFYHNGTLSLEQIVQKIAHAPADIYQVDRRGYLDEGYYADIVLFDPNQTWQVNNSENLFYKCQWTPFHHQYFHTKVVKTFVNGHLKYDNGSIINNIKGLPLTFLRNA